MSPKGSKSVFKIGRITAAIILIILGFFGLFLPVLQGILFLAAGCLLLTVDFKPFRKWLYRLKKRYPQIRKPLRDSRRWLFRKKRKGPS